MAGHTSKRCMHEKMQREYCWQHMANEVNFTVRDCRECFLNSLPGNPGWLPQLFPPSSPLESISMDIMGPQLKTSNRHQLVSAITDCYSRMKRVIKTSKKTSSPFRSSSMDHRVIIFGTREYLWTDSRFQFYFSVIWVEICLFGS